MIALYVIIGLVVLLAIAAVISYNRFVRQRNLVQESWRQIDVELNRRHDLIPNLVETVRGYAAHERGVFEAVTQARAAAQQTLQLQQAGPEAQAPGYVTVYPCGQPVPTASNLNFVAGDTIPNAVVTSLGAGGKVCLFTFAPTHLIVDVNGWIPAI